MATNYTPIIVGAAANADTFNDPLDELDAAIKKNNWIATSAPGVNHDALAGYSVGSRWVDITSDIAYTCVDATTGAAIWLQSSVTSGTIPVHDIVGAQHTITGAQYSLVGATALDTLGLLTPSADVSAGATAILRSNAGALTLAGLTIGGLTASTLIYSSAGKAITSLANSGAQSYLSNNGSGTLAWTAGTPIVGTPGTITVATPNAAADPHTHAVTSSANPALTTTLLSTSSGVLTLQRLGIGYGAPSATAPVVMMYDDTATSGTNYLVFAQLFSRPASASAKNQYALRLIAEHSITSGSAVVESGELFGLSGNARNASTVAGSTLSTATAVYGIIQTTQVNAILGTGYCYKTLIGLTGNTTTTYGYYYASALGAATLINEYAFYAENVSKGATNKFAIYTNAGLNRLGDQLAIVGSADRQQFICTGFSTQAVGTPIAQITRNDATAGISAMLGLTALGSGAAGDGGSILLNGKSSTTAAQAMSRLSWKWLVATHASRTVRVALSAYDSGGERDGIYIDSDGSRALVGIGGTTPTARLHLPAGGTAANTAPLKFTTQASPLATAEQGTMELVGNSLQFTQLAKRHGIAMSRDTRTADFQLVSSAAESAAIITVEHGANYLEVGKSERIELWGTVQKDVGAPTNTLTIRTKYAGVTVHTVVSSNAVIAANTDIQVVIIATCRSVGATGTLQINSIIRIAGDVITPAAPSLVTIDTTTAQNTTVTAQFTNSSATNNLVIHQGYVLCIEPNK